MTTLFPEGPEFAGFPPESFELFAIPGRDERRRAIVATLHPPLEKLGRDLLRVLSPIAVEPLHAHLPRLDWPRGYQPFATWLALSRETHGYQAGPQLNAGVHAGYVALRLGWDTGADAFGRFEFLCRHSGMRSELAELALAADLRFRVYAAEPWPEGSRLVFETADDLVGSMDQVRRNGVWWELGRRYDLPETRELLCSAEFGNEAARVFSGLLPLYDRLGGVHSSKD
jgi:hypothetical protein